MFDAPRNWRKKLQNILTSQLTAHIPLYRFHCYGRIHNAWAYMQRSPATSWNELGGGKLRARKSCTYLDGFGTHLVLSRANDVIYPGSLPTDFFHKGGEQIRSPPALTTRGEAHPVVRDPQRAMDASSAETTTENVHILRS